MSSDIVPVVCTDTEASPSIFKKMYQNAILLKMLPCRLIISYVAATVGSHQELKQQLLRLY